MEPDKIRQVLDKQKSPRQRFKLAVGKSESRTGTKLEMWDPVSSIKMTFEATRLAKSSRKECG